jgi:hypothetical protein
MKIVYLPHNVPLCDAMAAKVHVHLVSSVTLLHHNLIPTVDFLPAETTSGRLEMVGKKVLPRYTIKPPQTLSVDGTSPSMN